MISNLQKKLYTSENKRVAGGPDHQLNGYGILRSTYGANTNGEIARKKVARLVSKERFEEIERMPAAEQNAEVHKITNGYALTDTPVNIGFDGNEQISPTSHSELKRTRDLTAIKVKTNQGGNYAHLNSADRSKNNADISLTYNPQLKTVDFNPEATPEKYLPKDRTTEETPNTYWTGLSEANSLNGGTLSGGTPDGESQGDYGKKYLHSGDIKPNAGLHEFNHLIAYAIGNAGVPDKNGLYPHILTPGFGDKGNLHLAGLDENINALSLFKGMMSRKYGISVQNASHLRNFYEEFWQDKTSDSTEDKALKESIRSKIPPETRRLFDLMDSSKNLDLFYQFLDWHNIMNQVSLPKSKQKNDVDYIPTMMA